MTAKIKEFYDKLLTSDMISGDVMLSMLVRDFEVMFYDELREISNDNDNRSE